MGFAECWTPRKIYIIPRRKRKHLKFFNTTEEESPELRTPLYGNGDSGDYWGATFDRHAKQDLNMTPTAEEPSLYIIVSGGSEKESKSAEEPEGCMGNFVDEDLLAGDKAFQKITYATLQKFESRERIMDNFEFFGYELKTIFPGELMISQREYICKIGILPSDTDFELYRSYRADVALATHTRPDICSPANCAAQVTREEGQKVSLMHIKLLNSAIKRIKATLELGLKYNSLDEDALSLRVYTDASFGSNEDYSSQPGFVVLLRDASNRCHILKYLSKTSKRIVRSILGREVYAFAEEFDCAFLLKHDLEPLYRKKIPIQMRTDSKQMFDVITKASSTSERRLMMNISAT